MRMSKVAACRFEHSELSVPSAPQQCWQRRTPSGTGLLYAQRVEAAKRSWSVASRWSSEWQPAGARTPGAGGKMGESHP
eukprot:1044435-Amphidinium_carterae.1